MSKRARNNPQERHRAGGLLLIGVLKLLKAAFFLAVGIGALRLLHRDLEDIALRISLALKFDPESRFVNAVLDHVQDITPHRLKQISLASISYAAVATVEGIGLIKEKVWAEYLTIILTASFLPFEIIEIIHRLTWMKIVVTLINVAVLVYLIIYVQRMRKRLAMHAAAYSNP
jgi:uncharacterized membrane protein (DUF2068 family)